VVDQDSEEMERQKLQKEIEEEEAAKKREAKRIQILLIIIAALTAVVFILQIAALAMDWSEIDYKVTILWQQDETWTFSLLACKDCNDTNDGKSIDCFRVEECAKSDASDLCIFYNDFQKAGLAYFACAVITFFCGMAVLERVLLQSLKFSHVDHSWGIAFGWIMFAA
jgi:hypothetical protein